MSSKPVKTMLVKWKKVMRLCKVSPVLFFVLLPLGVLEARERGFTQEDRDRLIKLEATLQVFMQQVDKRFEELRQDMNKRFEQVDKRFEDVQRRFEQLTEFLWMLVAIFTSLTAVVIGFAYWDRRTIIRKARDEAVELIEKEGRLQELIRALRKLSLEDPKLAEVLRSFRLL